VLESSEVQGVAVDSVLDLSFSVKFSIFPVSHLNSTREAFKKSLG
jgi:hypothetical protein